MKIYSPQCVAEEYLQEKRIAPGSPDWCLLNRREDCLSWKSFLRWYCQMSLLTRRQNIFVCCKMGKKKKRRRIIHHRRVGRWNNYTVITVKIQNKTKIHSNERGKKIFFKKMFSAYKLWFSSSVQNRRITQRIAQLRNPTIRERKTTVSSDLVHFFFIILMYKTI